MAAVPTKQRVSSPPNSKLRLDSRSVNYKVFLEIQPPVTSREVIGVYTNVFKFIEGKSVCE